MLSPLSLLALTPVLQTAVLPPANDADAAFLRKYAERPAEPGALQLGPVGTGSLLFDFVGVDNAECVRGIDDINGDGRGDIVVGIGASGQDNLFCLDGASSGSASVLWSLQTTDGASGGYVNGDQSIVPVSDTETSGDANVLVGTGWGGRTAYNYDTLAGTEVIKFDTYLSGVSGWVFSLCEIGDVTSDGVPEYAFGVGSDNNSVYLLDGASPGPQATVLWKYPAGDAVYSVRNLGDTNGDGSDDVLAAIGDDIDRIVCLEGDTGSPSGSVLWTYTPGASVYACGVHSDVTGDGVAEALAVLWISNGTAIRCLNGATGAVVWTSTTVTSPGVQVDALEDLDGDGIDEIIVSSWENASIVLDGSDGTEVWSTTVGTTNGGDIWTSTAIDDISGDGVQDVIGGSFDYHVYAFDGVTGATLWAYNTGNRIFSVSTVDDVNDDGRPDVVAGTQDTTSLTVVYVLDGDGGLLPDLYASFCDDADGSLASCPCAAGTPESGCDIAQGTGGVALDVVAQETSPINRATLSGTGFPSMGTPASIVIRAGALDTAAPVVFGDGLRCVGTPIVRLGAAFATGGTSTHTFGHGAMAGTGDNVYQLWFRNTPISYCDPAAAFNLSNGRTLAW
jgi:hypothetical protein